MRDHNPDLTGFLPHLEPDHQKREHKIMLKPAYTKFQPTRTHTVLDLSSLVLMILSSAILVIAQV